MKIIEQLKLKLKEYSNSQTADFKRGYEKAIDDLKRVIYDK